MSGGLPAPRFRAIIDLRLGDVAFRLRDAATARNYYELVLAQQPERAEALRPLVDIYAATGEWDRCAEMLGRLAYQAETPAERAELTYREAEVFRLHLLDEERASAGYLKAVDYHPEHAPSLRRLIPYYFAEGDVSALGEVLAELDRQREPIGDDAVEAALGFAIAGAAAGDCAGHNPLTAPGGLGTCYLHHIGRTYWKHALEQEYADSPLAKGPICPFTAYYQFFRESLFALAKGGHFVLLYDERSPVFVKKGNNGISPNGLWTFLLDQAPPAMAGRLHAVTIQDVVAEIDKHPLHQDWIGLFKRKYGLN